MDQNQITATDILLSTADILQSRKRCMASTVEMFNAKYKTSMTEAQGWFFMICLDNAEMQLDGFNPNNYYDSVSHSALFAECVLKQHSVQISHPEMVRPQAA